MRPFFHQKIVAKALLLIAALTPTLAAAEIEAFFTPAHDVRPVITRHLKSVRKSIDIAMYSFSERSLIDNLMAAARRGVQTRLLLHDAGQLENRVGELESAGIDVRYVNRIMHHKFAIIDGPGQGGAPEQAVLLTGSGNWSTSMTKDFDEDFLVLRNEPDIILSFQSEFNLLWENSRETGASMFPGAEEIGFTSDRTIFTSENMEVYLYRGEPSFRPIVEGEDGAAGVAIRGQIERASSQIDIATTHFRRPDIFQALKNALARGVRVRILLDGQEFEPDARDDGSNRHYDELLSALGAEVRYKTYSRYWSYFTAKQMHTKYMIVDRGAVMTGTFNWSYNAEINTFENLVLLADENVVSSYQTNFENIFQQNPNGYDTLLTELRASGGTAPCHFQPLPLSPDQLEELYSYYRRGACRGGE